MSVLDREALAASPLADLHALASELSIDGYRRLRKAELIDAILTRQTGDAAPEESAPGPEEPAVASEDPFDAPHVHHVHAQPDHVHEERLAPHRPVGPLTPR